MIGYGMEAKQDAWIAALVAMGLGVALFYFIYGLIFRAYPEIQFTSILQSVFGKYIGKLLGAIYVWYFAYVASRVLRDFGDLLLTVTTVIDIAVLGLYRASNAVFPLLLTAEKLKVGDLWEGMDAFALSMLIICGYFKITVFFNAAVAAGTDVLGLKKGKILIIPLGLAVWGTLIDRARNLDEEKGVG